MSIYCSPLRYPGGKNCIFSFISELFYENDLIGIQYAESYAGGSGLALRLLLCGYVSKIYINDLDRSIYSFWKIITEHPQDLIAWIENVEVTVDEWNKQKAIQDKKDEGSMWDLAKSTFFLNRTNVSGVLKGGIIGGYHQRGKYKITARFNKRDLIQRIERIADVRHQIVVSCNDGIKFTNKIEQRTEEIFIYLDPPYYRKGADLYMNYFSDTDHRRLARCANRLRSRWVITYDDQPFIRGLYPDNPMISHKLSQSASNRVGNELMIFSDQLTHEESVYRLKAPIALQYRKS